MRANILLKNLNSDNDVKSDFKAVSVDTAGKVENIHLTLRKQIKL